MTPSRSNLATTFTAPPVGALTDSSGVATTRFQIWLNNLFKRFLYIRGNLRVVTADDTCNLNDCTIQAVITAAMKETLPDPTPIQGQVYIIKNDATSTAAVTMATNKTTVLIDNALASTYVLNPGDSLVLESDGDNWIVLAKTSTISTPSSSPLTPPGLNPGGATPPPAPSPTGPPTLTVLPASGNPGEQVIVGGVLYQWVGASQFAGIPGFWEPVVAAPTLQDTHANRLTNYPPTNYTTGTLFYETDRLVVYIIAGGIWTYWSGAMNGQLGDLPVDLGAADAGFRFQATDYKHLYDWSGSAWAFDSNDAGSGFTVVSGPGFFIADGLYGLCDGSTYSVAQSDGSTANQTPAIAADTYLRR